MVQQMPMGPYIEKINLNNFMSSGVGYYMSVGFWVVIYRIIKVVEIILLSDCMLSTVITK